MTRKRSLETGDGRRRRLEDNARKQQDEANASDKAIDDMVRRSIEKHGP